MRRKLAPDEALNMLVQLSAETVRNAQNLRQVRAACDGLGLAPEVRRIIESALLYRVGPWWPVLERFCEVRTRELTDVTPMPMKDDDPLDVDIFGDAGADDLGDIFA